MSANLAFLREELLELAETITATEEAAQQAAGSFAWELSLNSLRARRKELLAEIQAAFEKARVAELGLSFDGAPVRKGTVEAGFLSEFLGHLQKLVFALGQAIASQPMARGPIPGDIMERTRLRLAAVAEGSFTVSIVGDAHPDLFGDSLISECFEDLHRLIDARDKVSDLAELLSRLGGRVQGHYTAFLDSLTSANASVEMQTWRDSSTSRVDFLDASEAKNISDALSLLQREEERDEQLTGRLIGLLQHRAQFEFEQRDGGPIIAGKVLPGALPKAIASYNCDVIACFSVETMGVEGREEVKENWTLIGLCPASS